MDAGPLLSVIEFIELTVKEIGEFTKAMFSLKKGDTISINGPLGTALNYDHTCDSVFIAGGSGITPFMSSIRYAGDKEVSKKKYYFSAI